MSTLQVVSPHPVARAVRAILSNLEEQPTLTPAPHINETFNRLVTIARTTPADAEAEEILAQVDEDGGLQRLHTLCAEGETALEFAWGEKLRTSANPAPLLAQFPYLAEYRLLATLETQFLRRLSPHARRVLFVGSGPLPLTSWQMATRHDLQVEMLDLNQKAHLCAMGWLEKLPGHQNLNCLHTDLFDLTDFSSYDAVILAAMVGRTRTEKEQVLTHLSRYMKPGQPLVARSTHGLRRLLYPQLHICPASGFKLEDAYHPTGKVVNSILLATRQ